MNILIDNRSGKPIYEQIYSQIKMQIISGDIKENEMLPSIRNLAKDLGISVITTKRAYDELEKDRFIYTAPAKGCFVSKRNPELIREENIKKLEDHLKEVIALSKLCQISKDEIIEMLDVLEES